MRVQAKKKKQRELDNAKSDKEIAQANADAAVFQAKALLENGLAEAKVSNVLIKHCIASRGHVPKLFLSVLMPHAHIKVSKLETMTL